MSCIVKTHEIDAPVGPSDLWFRIDWLLSRGDWFVAFLEDYRQGRPALGKTAWKQRLRSLLRSQKAQRVARNKFMNFKKVCKLVAKRKGAASGL